MLDRQKVKIMTELASYEQNQGKEDFKINEYYKNDYVGFHTICSVIWVTIGYVCVVGLFCFAIFDTILDDFSKRMILVLGTAVLIGYIVVMAVYILITHYIFSRKYKAAKHRIKEYTCNLTKLLDMYEKEKR